MRPKVILIHGNGGCTADDAWYPRVEKECAALGLTDLEALAGRLRY